MRMTKFKDAYYFSHDSNARSDENILRLRVKYGWEGYGLYWAIVEILRESSDGRYCIKNIPSLNIALNTEKYPENFLHNFINDCIEFELFTLKADKFYSNRLLRTIARFKEISSIRSANAKQKQSKGGAKSDRKGKKIKEKETKQPFEDVWEKYPKKDGRKAAERYFNHSVKTEKDFKDFNTAMNNYLESDTVKRGFVKNGSTFFNNWRDWIETPESVKIKSDLEPEKF